jgi:hypothetical protein
MPALLLSGFGPAAADSLDPLENRWESEVFPLVEFYCYDCHGDGLSKGELDLDRFESIADMRADRGQWQRIRDHLRQRLMPPVDEMQPTSEERGRIVGWIDDAVFPVDPENPDPGRVTLRRLNRVEYENTLRDLLGVRVEIGDLLPPDDSGYGFDNIGDVLSIPPILMEKYLAAAETIAQRVYEDKAARRRVLPHQAQTDAERIDAARRNVRDFASRAFRRPLREKEEDRLFAIMKFAWEQDASEAEIYQTVITAILSNPHFLFRVEADPAPDDPDGIRRLNDFEIASRLSYFLWSSMPDERLFKRAAAGELQDRDVLTGEVERMLADPKAHALVENFAGQWLQLRDVSRLMPDPQTFPEFDSELRAAMRRETEIFFEKIIRENRSVLEFLNADFTYVNERLAQHYGIPGVTGDDFQRVALGPGRRGVLTHASILMLTSNPTRTSPVKRGKWILDNILAEPPPPPPPDVPELESGGEAFGSLREQMEAHRANEACAVCHRTMDALGFGLENFDAVGAWRDRDGRFAIDASGALPGGRSFAGAVDLMEILAAEKREAFCRCLAQKLLTYALGRGLTSYDRCTVSDAVEALSEHEYRFGSLVTAIVTSDPFLLREARSKQ